MRRPFLSMALGSLVSIGAAPLLAQEPFYAWGLEVGGRASGGFGEVTAVAVDEGGTLYATGHARGALDLNGDGWADVSATNDPWSSNLFVAKFGTEGNLLWARTVTGVYSSGQALGVSADGNLIVVAGAFAGYARFPYSGQRSLHCPCATGTSHAAFAVAYDRLGNVRWARSFDGSDEDEFAQSSAGAVAVEPSGSAVVVGGSFWGGFDADADGSNDRRSSGQDDGFVAFLEADDGRVSWHRQIGGARTSNGAVAATTIAKWDIFRRQVVAVGHFDGEADFDGDLVPERTSPGTGWFAVAYGFDGRLEWYTGGGRHELATDVLWDPDRGVFHVATEVRGSPEGGSSTHLYRIDQGGVLLAASSRRIAGSSSVDVTGLSLDPAGNLWVGGAFTGSVDLDADGRPEHRSPTPDDYDIVLAAYGDAGLLWSMAATGGYHDWSRSIAVDRWNRIYLGGNTLSGAMSFDDDPEPELRPSRGVLARYDIYSLWRGEEWHDPDSCAASLPMEMAHGFGELELGNARNLRVEALYARDPKSGKLVEVSHHFEPSTTGCRAAGKGDCHRFTFRGGDPIAWLAVRVAAQDPKAPVLFTPGGIDAKGQVYAQPPVTLWLGPASK
jgi:hypothetical protein